MARGVPVDAVIESYERYGHLGLVARDVGLGRSTVEAKLKKEGVIARGLHEKGTRRGWHAREDAQIRAGFVGCREAGSGYVRHLAADMGRSHGAVIDRAWRLGLPFLGGWDLIRDEGIVFNGLPSVNPYEVEGMPLRIEVPGKPIAWQRAGRNTGGISYTPGPVQKAQDRLACAFAGLLPIRMNVSLALTFYLADAKRVDEDNLGKLVKDAGNDGGLWEDDYQVTESAVRLTIDREHPRTVIAVDGYVDESIPRGSFYDPVCQGCGERFLRAGRANPTTCSRECKADVAARGQDALAL